MWKNPVHRERHFTCCMQIFGSITCNEYVGFMQNEIGTAVRKEWLMCSLFLQFEYLQIFSLHLCVNGLNFLNTLFTIATRIMHRIMDYKNVNPALLFVSVCNGVVCACHLNI